MTRHVKRLRGSRLESPVACPQPFGRAAFSQARPVYGIPPRPSENGTGVAAAGPGGGYCASKTSSYLVSTCDDLAPAQIQAGGGDSALGQRPTGAKDGKAPPYGDTETAYMNVRRSLGASNAAAASPTGGRMIADNRSAPRHSWSLNLDDLEPLRAVGKIGPNSASNFSLHKGHTHW